MVYVEKAQPRVGALSLTHLTRLKCTQNAHLINDIGLAPYHLVEPILKKKTAKSLKIIESKSPQIIPYSEPLWRCLIERDFNDRPLEQITIKNGKKRKVPARDLYDKYVVEREKQRQTAAENLKQITRNLNQEKNRTKVKALNHVIVPSYKKKAIQQVQRQPAFKSSLLQKAMHQNKLRSRFLGQQKINPPRLSQVSKLSTKSISQITTISSAALPSSNRKRPFTQSPPATTATATASFSSSASAAASSAKSSTGKLKSINVASPAKKRVNLS